MMKHTFTVISNVKSEAKLPEITAGIMLAKKIKLALAPNEPWPKVAKPLGHKMAELKKKLRPIFEHMSEIQFLHEIGGWSVEDIKDAFGVTHHLQPVGDEIVT